MIVLPFDDEPERINQAAAQSPEIEVSTETRAQHLLASATDSASLVEDKPTTSVLYKDRSSKSSLETPIQRAKKKQTASTLSATGDAILIRVLVYLYLNPGSNSFLWIAENSGVSKDSVVRCVDEAERQGWLTIVRGRNNWHPDGPRPNYYSVTPEGLAQIPSVLLEGRLKDDYALDLPIWNQSRGYGLAGLILALTIPMNQKFTAADAAEVLGTTRNNAANILARLDRKGGYLISRIRPGVYCLHEDTAHNWTSMAMYEEDDRRRARVADQRLRTQWWPITDTEHLRIYSRFVHEHFIPWAEAHT